MIGEERMRRQIDSGGLRHRVAGNADQANTTLGDRGLNCQTAHGDRLDGGVGGFTVMAAIGENSFRMRFLKVFSFQEARRYLTGNRKDRRPVTVGIVEPLDQMQVARPT